MKLKKRFKIVIVVLLLIFVLIGLKVFVFDAKGDKTKVEEVKVLNTIPKYEYKLKDNKSKRYKTEFRELEKILTAKEVDYDAYVNKITEMFIIDFFSLNDRLAKTDIGGVEFLHPEALDNFTLKAQDTYYKYIESNLYGERKQKLPTVDTITINTTEQTKYYYNNKEYEAYKVNATWTYTSEEFNTYQKVATLIFVKDGIKLELVELK